MTKIYFTLNSDEIQRIIEHSVQDDVSKHILTTIFNQLMENQRTEYIQAESYERSNQRQSQRNGYYNRVFVIRDGEFSPTPFERYQRNEKLFWPQC